ncbi:hypothetical protein K435DRAFT_791739 [Dendrothele bispora CBS 962.96]|uniref:Uncharacterized protein n=1 Tax=Dendrothele bispora (strain CBS 962.96) TaxID=1314807 RepID=A0A4V4HHP8_DENBC|nr:hypothetical protein K435DRAFT_791739 [Dendrothele bispora CBS 962.96]
MSDNQKAENEKPPVSGSTIELFRNSSHISINQSSINIQQFEHGDHNNQAKDVAEKIKWIRAPDPFTNFNTACKNITEGTGTWLVSGNETFHMWKIHGHLLWLQGKAGSGKTFLW